MLMHGCKVAIFYFLRVPSFYVAVMPNFSRAVALKGDDYFLDKRKYVVAMTIKKYDAFMYVVLAWIVFYNMQAKGKEIVRASSKLTEKTSQIYFSYFQIDLTNK